MQNFYCLRKKRSEEKTNEENAQFLYKEELAFTEPVKQCWSYKSLLFIITRTTMHILT
jgi:hypothetical protein